MTMNVLIVCQYYHPEQFLINEIAPELVKRGHRVTVLTGLPNYPGGVVPEEYRRGRRRENLDGVSVIRCYERGRGRGKLALALNYFSFMLSASRMAGKLESEFDLVLCYQLSPVTMLAPAITCKRRYKIPLLAYCLDIWPESALEQVGPGVVYRLIAKYSRRLYQQCDRIAVTSLPFVDYLHRVNGIPRDRLVYLPQHANGKMLHLDLTAEDNGRTDFMFAGNLGQGQKLETIIKAAARIRARGDFLVHIVGDGSMRGTLEKLSRESGTADRVVFHGAQPRDGMAQWYSKADALLITLRGNNFVGHTMPGKLQTYMTTGKPILGAVDGAARQVIEEAQCGRCVPAEDDCALAEIMLDYINHREKYSHCGANARNYFMKHFTFEVFMDRLEHEMRMLI